jgi:DNA-binding NarL/FixJ family response regulator
MLQQRFHAPGTLSRALESLGVSVDLPFERLLLPMILLDADGRIRWQNPAAVELLGDRSRARFTSIVAPDYRSDVQHALARGLLGLVDSAEEEFVVLGPWHERVRVSANCVQLTDGDEVVGILKVMLPLGAPLPAAAQLRLPPRLHETLRLLAEGLPTGEIAGRLGVTHDTARAYIQRLLRSLGVHSRLEAVVRGRERGLL